MSSRCSVFFAQPGGVFRIGGFGRKGVVRGLARQNRMHLAKPPADRRGDRFAVGQQIASESAIGSADRAIERARQMIEDPRPGIALIADETESDGQRGRRAVACRSHDVAEERRRVGKAVAVR